MSPTSSPAVRSLDSRIVRVLATFLAAIVLAALFAPAAVAGTGTEADPYMPGDSVRICHSGNGKKFVVNNPSVSSGGETTGHEGHNHDIFPPYWFKQNVGATATFYPGQNWTTDYDGQSGRQIWENNCARANEPATAPGASVLDTCHADGVRFTLDNSASDVALTFVGTHADSTQAFSNEVAANASETQVVVVAEDTAFDITVTVTYESTVIYSQRFQGTRDCDPNATIAPTARLAPCAAAGFEFTLDNDDSDVALTFVGTHADSTQAFSEEVAANGTETVTVPVAEDAAYDITVTVTHNSGQVYSQRFNGTRDCQPTIVIRDDPKPDPKPDPDPIPTVTLVPGISIDKSADDDTYTVGETITYTYVVTNTGESTLSTVSLHDDVLGNLTGLLETRTLEPGDSTTVTTTQVVTDDHVGSLTNVAVASGRPPEGARVSATDEVTVDVAAVLGVVIDKPEPAPAPAPAPVEPAPVEPAPEVAAEELPRTGLDSGQLAWIAFAMLLLGARLLRRPEWE